MSSIEQKLNLKECEDRVNEIRAQRQMKADQHKKILQEQQKRIIVEYKEEKRLIQKALWEANLIHQNRKLRENQRKANQMLMFFRQKDEQFIRKFQKKRSNNQNKKLSKIIEKLISQHRKNIKVKRDPTRLLNSTVEWRQKIMKTDNESQIKIFTEHSDITNIPHLAVPAWRKQFSLV